MENNKTTETKPKHDVDEIVNIGVKRFGNYLNYLKWSISIIPILFIILMVFTFFFLIFAPSISADVQRDYLKTGMQLNVTLLGFVFTGFIFYIGKIPDIEKESYKLIYYTEKASKRIKDKEKQNNILQKTRAIHIKLIKVVDDAFTLFMDVVVILFINMILAIIGIYILSFGNADCSPIVTFLALIQPILILSGAIYLLLLMFTILMVTKIQSLLQDIYYFAKSLISR